MGGYLSLAPIEAWTIKLRGVVYGVMDRYRLEFENYAHFSGISGPLKRAGWREFVPQKISRILSKQSILKVTNALFLDNCFILCPSKWKFNQILKIREKFKAGALQAPLPYG